MQIKQLVANTRELHHAQRRRGFENVIKNNLLQKKKIVNKILKT